MPTVKLYVKQHLDRKINYFGKTIKKDVDKYPGSGTYWTRILNNHGNKVSTFIVGEFEKDDPYLIEFALGFCAANNIGYGDISEWANIILEDGQDYGFGYLPEWRRKEIGKSISKAKKGNTVVWNKGLTGIYSEDAIEKIRKANYGKKYSDEINKKKGRSGKENAMANPIHRQAVSDALKGQLKTRCCCLECKKEVAVNRRFSHFCTTSVFSPIWIHTPFGKFKSMGEACNSLGLSMHLLRRKMKTEIDYFKYRIPF